MEVGITFDRLEPEGKITAAVSLIERPTPRMTPVTMPGSADGSTTLTMLSHLLAPSDRPTSRYEAGTALIASSEVLMIVGRIMNASVRPPARIDHPKPRTSTKKTKPNRPKMIDGTPARHSAPKRMM